MIKHPMKKPMMWIGGHAPLKRVKRAPVKEGFGVITNSKGMNVTSRFNANYKAK